MLKNTFREILGAAGSKIEVLKCMPQRVEGGVVFDFNNKAMFNVANNDKLIFATGNVGSRFTDALVGRYLGCLNNANLQVVNADLPTNEVAEPTLYDKVTDAVGAGDKKLVRALCKELKEKWFAIDDADVEDAIDDIKDCVSDKDVEGVKEIISDVTGEGNVPDEPTEEQSDPNPSDGGDKKAVEISETAQEILDDLESAIKDNDEKDIKELLAELADEVGTDSAVYLEWSEKAKADVPQDAAEDNSEVDEIVLDLEDAVNAGDLKDAKEILAELGDAVGTDSELYKEWAAKVELKETRRSRRGK